MVQVLLNLSTDYLYAPQSLNEKLNVNISNILQPLIELYPVQSEGKRSSFCIVTHLSPQQSHHV